MVAVPQIGANILYASQNGCVPDCVVATGAKVGGGTPTNNTTALNALLAYATTLPGGAVVILDGGFACGSLLISSNVELRGTGLNSGLFLISGSDFFCITNWTSTVQSVMTNIAVTNMTINGNYPNNGAVGSFFACGLFLYNVTGVRVADVAFINVTCFNVCLETVNNAVVDHCSMTSTWTEGDGIHVSGGAGCSNLKFTRNTISTIDDGIALNAPEQQRGPTNGGPISDVEISDNVYIGALSLVRMYSNSAGGATVSRVMISNNSGTFTGQAWASGCVLFLGNGDTLADGLQTVTLTGVTASLTDSSGHFVKISDCCGTIKVTGTWDSPVAANPFVYFQTSAVAVSDLSLENCTIYRSTKR